MDDYDKGYIDAMDLCAQKINRLDADIHKLKYDNEQLRETVTNQEIVIKCHQEASQSLDIGMGD